MWKAGTLSGTRRLCVGTVRVKLFAIPVRGNKPRLQHANYLQQSLSIRLLYKSRAEPAPFHARSDQALAGRAKRRKSGQKADLADAPGGTLSARISRASGGEGRLPRSGL